MPAGEPGSLGKFQLNPVDRFGRAIDPSVLNAAESLGQRVIKYGEKLVGDPAVAVNLLEESAAAVSRILRTKQKGKFPIRDLQAYLFRAFIRRVNKLIRRRPRPASSPPSFSVDLRKDLERKILIDEFLRGCDPVTREVFYRRVQGFSWKEIGKMHGISAHTAESRFGKAFQRVRKRFGYRD